MKWLKESPPPCPRAVTDTHLLEQVLINLLLNAAQVTARGGAIRLGTEAGPAPPGGGGGAPARPGPPPARRPRGARPRRRAPGTGSAGTVSDADAGARGESILVVDDEENM